MVQRALVEGMTFVAIQLWTKFLLHFLYAGVMTFATDPVHIGVYRVGYGARAVRLAVADKTFD